MARPLIHLRIWTGPDLNVPKAVCGTSGAVTTESELGITCKRCMGEVYRRQNARSRVSTPEERAHESRQAAIAKRRNP